MLEKNISIEKGDKIIEIRLLAVLKKKILWILLVGLAVGAMIFAYISTMVTPMYSATAMLYVNNASVTLGGASISLTQGDITASRSLVDTLVVILNNSTVLDEVIEKTGVPYTYGQLKGMISASAENATEVMKITVTTDDPEKSAMLADTIAEILPIKISEIIDGSSTRLVANARLNRTPVSPNTSRSVVLGSVVAMFLFYAVLVFLDAKDQTIYSVDAVINTYDVPLLGEVPNLVNPGKSSYYRKKYRYGNSKYKYEQSKKSDGSNGGKS